MAKHTQRLEDRSDDELAVLAQRRRTDSAGARALEILVERYRRQRYALAHRYGGGMEADDVAQEAALALVRAVDTYQAEEGPAGPWIWQWMWGSSLRAAMKSWSCRGALALDDIEAGASEPADGRFETSMEDEVVAAQLRKEENAGLQAALRHLPGEGHDALVFPQLASASRRRTAVAMLRHPSVRPVAASHVHQGVVAHGHGQLGTGSRRVDEEAVPPDPRGLWVTLAACRQMPVQLFWGRERGNRAAALAVCAECPVKEDCLLDSLVLPAGGGIRAGTTEKQRRILKRLYKTPPGGGWGGAARGR